MASGGKREGAGRKKKAEKYEPQITAAEDKIADRLPELLDNLFHLAKGGYERIEDKCERRIKKDSNGAAVLDENGRPVYHFVSTERKVTIADKDLRANIYLVDRILGRPTEHQEIDATIDGEIDVTLEAKKLAAKELEKWRQEQMKMLETVQKPQSATTQAPAQPQPPKMNDAP